MGKEGRFACIFTPYLLSIASLICIILVGSGCTRTGSWTLDHLYFFRFNLEHMSASAVNTQQVQTLLNQANLPAIGVNQVQNAVSQIQHGVNVKDFYSVGLWGYCDGYITNNTVYHTNWCSQPKAEFYFNPLRVWGLDNSAMKSQLPSGYNNAMKMYRDASKWMFIAYILSFVTTILELIVGFSAIFSRWGSCATTLISTAAFCFTAAASITATVLFTILKASVEGPLKPYGIRGYMGARMFATTWLAVVFALGASIFWMFSSCCCSGRDSDNRDSFAGEKSPYDYGPLGSNHNTAYPPPGNHTNDIPMGNTGYQPYHH